MTPSKSTKRYVVITRLIVMLVIIAAIFTIHNMRQTSDPAPGELPEEFIHDHQVGIFDLPTFEERRARILEEVDADLIIISADANPDFRYVTGFSERQGIAVIRPGEQEAYQLFVTPWEIYTVMWTGEVYGKDGAVEKFGADAAYPLDDFEEKLPGLLDGKSQIYLHNQDHAIRQMVMGQLLSHAEIKEIAPILHEHRVFKDDWEIAQLRQSVDVTVKAHQYLLQAVRPGLTEYEIQAEIEYIFRRNGMGAAFPPIVGSGPNSCLLHHSPADRVLEDGDVLLMDFGARSLGGYRADVTRTIPVNGTFSPEQRKIYEIVLKANDAAKTKMKPGYRLLDGHHLATQIMVDELHEMGLIPDTTSWWQKRFYIQHRIYHYIGLEMHDAGDHGYDHTARNEHILTPEIRGREIMPGMVITNEPGLYFMVGLLDGIHEMFGHLATEEELNAFVEEVRPIYEKYEGIGVRIEEDILITEDGNINLSANAPRTVKEIEAAMQ